MSSEARQQEKRIQRMIDQTARTLLKMNRRHAKNLDSLKLRQHQESEEFFAMLAPGMRQLVEAAAIRIALGEQEQDTVPSVEQGLAAIEPEMADE
jgi:hypothetical protein